MIEDAIKRVDNEKAIESIKQESAVSTVAINIVDAISIMATVVGNIFRTAAEVNPIAFISALLTRAYDKKVERYDTVCAMYQATKEAYAEYMKIPEKERNKKVESKYIKNMEKYNIKMNNLKAQIEHYDQRAQEDAKDLFAGNDIDDDDETSVPEEKTEDTDDKSSDSGEEKEPDEGSSSDNDNKDDGGFDF